MYAMNIEPDVLDTYDVARKLNISMWTVYDRIKQKNWNAIPKPFKLGGKNAWRKEDFDAWLKKKATEPDAPTKRGRGRPRRIVN